MSHNRNDLHTSRIHPGRAHRSGWPALRSAHSCRWFHYRHRGPQLPLPFGHRSPRLPDPGRSARRLPYWRPYFRYANNSSSLCNNAQSKFGLIRQKLWCSCLFGRSCRRLRELLVQQSSGCLILVNNKAKHTSSARDIQVDTLLWNGWCYSLFFEGHQHERWIPPVWNWKLLCHVFRAMDRRNTGDGKTDSHQRQSPVSDPSISAATRSKMATKMTVDCGLHLRSCSLCKLLCCGCITFCVAIGTLTEIREIR